MLGTNLICSLCTGKDIFCHILSDIFLWPFTLYCIIFQAGGSQSARESLYSGADDDDDDDVSKVIEDIREVVRRPIGRFEAIPDDMSPQEILDQVKIRFLNLLCLKSFPI